MAYGILFCAALSEEFNQRFNVNSFFIGEIVEFFQSIDFAIFIQSNIAGQ